MVSNVADFERRFPKDPRPHLVQAVLDVGRGNPAQAEAEARLGLSDPELLKSVFEPKVESALWMVLGEALAKKSKKDDARNAFDKALAVDPAQSEVYRQRAMLRFSEGAFDEALSDVRTLIARVPNDAGAHDLEGDILFAKGDLHAAIASYDAAIAIRPSFSNTFLARGVAKYLSSDAPGAIADVKHVAVLAPSNLYAPVWLDIVSARSGVGEPSRLEATLLQLWPAPILNLFSGAIAPEALASLARHEKAVGTDEPCEAVFYTGEWHVIHERTTTGRDLFRKAAQQCPPDFLESWAAQAEIKSIPANQ